MPNAMQQQARIAPEGTVPSVAVPIATTPDYVKLLNSLVHSQKALDSAGYIVERLSNEELESKKRCSGCGKQMSRLKKNKKFKDSNKDNNKNDNNNNKNKNKHARVVSTSSRPSNIPSDSALGHGNDPANSEPRMRCKFHSGRLQSKTWSCCGKKPTDDPCVQREFHIPKLYGPGEIERLWQHHPTNNVRKHQPSHRIAVAIDCEMGTSVSDDRELIRVTLLDYFSGQVLIDKLVWPDVPMLHLNTRYSGILWSDLSKARRRHSCLYGRNNARAAVLQFVGPSTIVVGHSVQNDLKSLRWIHHKIVDTYILEFALKEAAQQANQPATNESPQEIPPESVSLSATEPRNTDESEKRPKGRGLLSLKTLAKVKLGRDIQVGRNGHDSVEDALAARDLVHAYLTQHLNGEIRNMAT